MRHLTLIPVCLIMAACAAAPERFKNTERHEFVTDEATYELRVLNASDDTYEIYAQWECNKAFSCSNWSDLNTQGAKFASQLADNACGSPARLIGSVQKIICTSCADMSYVHTYRCN